MDYLVPSSFLISMTLLFSPHTFIDSLSFNNMCALVDQQIMKEIPMFHTVYCLRERICIIVICTDVHIRGRVHSLEERCGIAEEIRYHLRSMGVEVDAPTIIYEDNQSVCMSATDPGSTLNKKSVVLSYHYIREHIANVVVGVRKIGRDDNYADPSQKV